MQGCCELEDVPVLPCLHGSVERPLHLGLGVMCIDLHLPSFHGCANMRHMGVTWQSLAYLLPPGWSGFAVATSASSYPPSSFIFLYCLSGS